MVRRRDINETNNSNFSPANNPANSDNLTGLISMVAAAVLLIYSVYLFLTTASKQILIINSCFWICYLLPLLLIKFRQPQLAKHCLLSTYIIHIYILSSLIFGSHTGFFVGLFLVPPLTFLLFSEGEQLLRYMYIIFTLLAFYMSQFIYLQFPIASLSEQSASQLFLITVTVCLFLLLSMVQLLANRVRAAGVKLALLTHTDELTGLLNRRFFMAELTQHFELALRYRRNFCLLLINVDKFSEINHSYGHTIGDAILKQLAKELDLCIRANDILARFDGEEFALILPESNLENSYIFAEKLRKKIQQINFEIEPGRSIQLTVSIGISQYLSEITDDQIISNAQKALYIAKQLGRNQVRKYQKG